MNAAETITAAIEKLVRLRGLQGSWTLQGGSEYIHPIGVTVAPDDGGVTGREAELIVTLHRTIDAQLTILKVARHERPANQNLALDLARAILGEAS